MSRLSAESERDPEFSRLYGRGYYRMFWAPYMQAAAIRIGPLVKPCSFLRTIIPRDPIPHEVMAADVSGLSIHVLDSSLIIEQSSGRIQMLKCNKN
jgi:hypothetical protein